jgi:hypothetical protein
MKRIVLFLTLTLISILLSACTSGSTVDLTNITCDGIKLGDNIEDVLVDNYTLSDRFPERDNTINFEEWKITTDDEGIITKIHANVSDIKICSIKIYQKR